MQNKEKVAKRFAHLVEKYGLVGGIYLMFGEKAEFSLGFSPKLSSLSVDELSISVRGYNVLKRSGLNTVGDVIDAINNKTLITLRNLGRKTHREIIINVVDLGYSHLSDDQKIALLNDIIDKNLPTE